MKFCSECGTRFVDSAKFCGECGKPRTDTVQIDSVSTSGQGLNWESFVKTYKPKNNQFAEINEAFDGYFYPSWGAVGDWLRFEDLGYVWSIEAKADDLKSLTCKSGRWSGPDIIGYFYCDVSVPEKDDIEFELPDAYANFRGFVVKRDQESQKWRPCTYRLRGDSSHLPKVDGTVRLRDEDDFHRDLEEDNKASRAHSQAMIRLTLHDADERDKYAAALDPRYFLLCGSPAVGWIDNYVNEYEPLDTSFLVGCAVDEYEHLLMLNTPTSVHYEVVSRCSICDAEADDPDLEEFSDHACMDGDIQGQTFFTFNPDSKLQYIRIHIPLSQVQEDEPGFRIGVLPYLHREFLAQNLNGFEYHEREVNEMSDEPFQLAFDREAFSFEKLTKSCETCFKRNPDSAQVCYNCCNPFVSQVKGQIFATILNEVETGQVAEMSSEDFSSWANIYYFVAQDKHTITFVCPPILNEDPLMSNLNEKVSPLSGVDGFFNFAVKVGRHEWNFSGSTTDGSDDIQLLLAGQQVDQSSIEALEEAGWSQELSGQTHVFEKWHAFAEDEDWSDAIRLGLGWLQLITGASPEQWTHELEVHFGA